MSHAPESIQLAIAELEARSRHYETHAGECRETAATLRRLFEVSTLSPALVAISAPRTTLASSTHRLDPDPFFVPEAPRPEPPAPTSVAEPRAWKGDTIVDHDSRRARVLQVIRAAAGRPMSSSDVHDGVAELGIATVGLYLRELVEDGTILREGKTRLTRYRIADGEPAPSASSPEKTATAATVVTAEPAAVPVEDNHAGVDAAGQESHRAKVAFFILRDVLTSAPMHIGDIVVAVHDKFGGGAAFEEIAATVEDLVIEGAAARVMKGREPHFQKAVAPARPMLAAATVPSTSVIGKIKQELLERVILRNGSDHTVPQLLERVRAVPGADLNQLRVALDQLVTARDIGVRTVGLERRYARRPA